jgi:peptidoglycan-associated lipoprotein
MKVKSSAWLTGAAMIGAVGMSGCATQGYVRENVAVVDQKVTATNSRLDQDETHLTAVDRTSREALERAQAAGKLAEGKFLYSMVLSDDSVKFPVNGSQLSAEAQTRLMDFVEKLKADNKNVYLEIQGHTDSTGAKPVNARLGEERAEAVRLFMNRQGVPLNRMATISYGEEAPVAPNTTRAGRAQNRRVVVIVMA